MSPLAATSVVGTETVRVAAEPAMAAAGRRVAAQMIAAMLTESLLPSADVSVLSDGDGRLTASIRARGGAVRYLVSGRRSFAYGRWLIEGDTLRFKEGDDERPCDDPCALLADLKAMLPGDDGSFARFAEEIAQTWVNHAATLEEASAVAARLAGLGYDLAEARLTDGHRYHPAFKSRIGFSPRDNRAYGPEFANEIRPVWLAVADGLASSAAIGRPEAQDPQLLDAAWGGDGARAALDRGAPELRSAHLLPVHPWQWEHVVEAATAPLRAAGRIVVLGEGEARYLAQQSIRTMANIGDRSAPSLKLALSIRNTSTARTLARHTVLNAPRISAWLEGVRAADTYLRQAGTILLLERMGTSVALPERSDPAGRTTGAMAAIWRDPVYAHLKDGEQASPFSMLTHLDHDGRPAIAGWIAAHGLDAWTEALLRAAMLPVLHMLLVHGVAIESHQQNMALVHRGGWPERVALKDFHDGVRFIPRLLSGPAPALVATPETHARVNPNSYVEASEPKDVRDFMFDALFGVNLAELAAFLHRHFGHDERRFWRTARDLIHRHVEEHPAAGEGVARYELFAPLVEVEDLARRRIDTRPAPPRPAPNPLVAVHHDQGGDGQ